MKTSTNPVTYSVGTLSYTQAGLFSLFGWLLWGDFVLTLMEAVLPNLMPLLLRDAGASNREIGFIMTSATLVIGVSLGPTFSTISDNTRSKWGRRKPYLFIFSPFVVLFLCAVPFSGHILSVLTKVAFIDKLIHLSPAAPAVMMLGAIVIGYSIFNIPVMNSYYCLVPDVVPKPVIGRFYAMFRVFGTLAGTLFNYFFLGKAKTHLEVVFIGIAVFYLVAIWIMCFKVKEGEHPPLPAKEKKQPWIAGAKTYARLCFGDPYFIIAYLAYAGLYWSYLSNSFTIFFFRDSLGFTVDSYGKLVAYGSMVMIVCYYPFGILVDKWGSAKSIMASQTATIIAMLLAFFIIHSPGQGIFFTILIAIPTTLSHLTIMKWLVDTYPPEKYGQFNASGVLVYSIGGIFLGSFCGYLLDLLKDYRYVYIWSAFFRGVSLLAAFWVFRHKPKEILE